MRLADILAEDSGIEGVAMNKHKFLKHRFSNVITSKAKKEMWACITTKFNSSAINPNSSDDLEKKWFNLVSRHKSQYAEYKRDSLLTGGGKGPQQPSALTEAVMAAIGKKSASVSGISSGSYLNDSTLLDNDNEFI